MDSSVLHVDRHDTHALIVVVHDQIERKILNHVRRVERQRAPVEGVKHGVTGAVGRAGGAVGLAALPVVQGLAAEWTLVDLAVLGARERQAKALELEHGCGRLPGHVVNGVLVAQPVRPLDRVIHVPPPVVRRHVTQRSVDATLRGYSVRARREELSHASSLEARLGSAHRGTETGASGADDNDVVFVVHDRVIALGREGATGRRGRRGPGGRTQQCSHHDLVGG
mmetsp:Transcript_39691/g.91336  ORF Transcript_39691/g.91336 Transcript_39691/m.91336 type:complete len:225 (-) Transcript_39691:31-705(-)